MNNRERIFRIIAISLMIDQFIKILINHYMNLYQEIVLIPHFFSLLYVKNTGAAFSIFENNTILLSIISAVFIILLIYYGGSIWEFN